MHPPRQPLTSRRWLDWFGQLGDRIRIDFPNRRMDILVAETELAERKKNWQPVQRDLSGWLARYRKLVTNASQGGILA